MPTPRPITAEDRKVLESQHDCNNWEDYIRQVADNTGLSVADASLAFDMLGPSEAFDGFVITCEDEGANADSRAEW